MMMRGREYLTKSEQYALVYNKGDSWASAPLVMKTLPNSLAFSRYGFSVSRRVGGAVIRNRVKRRLREILRSQPLAKGRDIIFIARAPIAAAKFSEINGVVHRLLLRAGLLAEENEESCLSAN